MENRIGALVQARAQEVVEDFAKLGESFSAAGATVQAMTKCLEETREAICKAFVLDSAILGYVDEFRVSKEARYLKNFEPPVIKFDNVHQLTPDELKEAFTCDIPENPTIANTDKAWSLYSGPFSKIRMRRFRASRGARDSTAKAAIQAEEDRAIFSAINAVVNDDEEAVGCAMVRGMMRETFE